MACSRGKSRFLRQQKDVWDHLAEEVRLWGKLATRLTAAQQRVVELMPTTKEVASLRA
jgi:hypothetical protein